jgi:hypothetical protein
MVTGLIGALAALSLTGLVEADTGGCPDGNAVEEQLLPLIPPPAQRAPRRAVVQRSGGVLRVELRDPAGRVLAARELPATASCGDLAAAAAVVLGSAWRAAPAPELPPLHLDADAVLRRPALPPKRLPWEVAASAFVSFAGSGGAPAAGGALETTITPRGRRLGARVVFLGAGLREEPVGPGRAAWTRLALGAGPRYGLDKGRFLLSLHAEGLVAVVLARGEGFAESFQSADVDLGLGGGVRIGLRLGPVAPFIGGTILGWLRPQTIHVANIAATVDLPRFEVLLAAGVALGQFP